MADFIRRDDDLLDPEAVTVCVASIGRPSLVALIRSLETMRRPVSDVRVIVADDSADGAARRLVEESGPWQLPVDVYAVRARNIAAARNVCIEHARSLFIAFVDDDERVDVDWLCNLRNAAVRYNADAVFGAVNAIYPVDTPPWLRKVGLFRKRPGNTGTHVNTGATGNALVNLKSVRKFRLRFNEAFGRSGGEDTEFFFRLAAAGGTLVACAEALVYEEIPADRLKIAHLRKRYTRGGHTYARVMLADETFARRMLFYAGALIKMTATAAMALAVWPFRRDLGLVLATRFWGHAGKLLYAADRPSPQPY